MAHVFEAAKTGRAKCRGCSQLIEKGTQRFGERVPNPFADDGGETTNWYHVPCAAFMRPEAFLAGLPDAADPVADRERLEREAQLGVAHRRLPRATAVSHAATGRATCRHCKQLIDKGAWRIALLYYDEGRFAPSGFIHITCAREYLETTDVMGRLRQFSKEVSDEEFGEIERELTKV